MMIHLEDRGKINTGIDDNGSCALVCSKCNRLWTGDLQPATVDGQIVVNLHKRDQREILAFAKQRTNWLRE